MWFCLGKVVAWWLVTGHRKAEKRKGVITGRRTERTSCGAGQKREQRGGLQEGGSAESNPRSELVDGRGQRGQGSKLALGVG